MEKTPQTKYCFRQEAGSSVHQLYVYDDVTKYGTFNWFSWEYEESETSADYFRKALAEIPETDSIELHINSNGGSVKEGIAIYNQLKRKKCKEIVGYVDGFAYSIASIILQACDRRIMGLGTSILVHNMLMDVFGNAEELRKAADDLDVLMEGNRQVYLERATISEEELISMMNAETFLNPDQAVAMGFADEVETVKKDTEPDPKAEPDPEPEDMEKESAQKLQTMISQLRKKQTEQKEFRTDLIEFYATTKKKTTTDEKNMDPEKDPEQHKTTLAALLAKAASRNLTSERN